MKTKNKILTLLLSICFALCVVSGLCLTVNSTSNSAFASVSRSITASDGGVTYLVSVANSAYSGDTVTVTFTPSSGYVVDGCNFIKDGEMIPNDATRDATDPNKFTFIMPDSNVTINSYVSTGYYIINNNATADTAGNKLDVSISSVAGQSVTINATVATGYELSAECLSVETSVESIDVTSKGNNVYEFIMPNAEVEVSADFSKIDYAITNNNKDADTYGNKLATAETAQIGDTVTIDVECGTGYIVDTITVKKDTTNVTVTSVTANEQYTFVMPAGAVTVSATFVKGVSTLEELKNALTFEGDSTTIKLTDDIEITEDFDCSVADKTITINTNGKTITATNALTMAHGTVKFIGDGTIIGRVNVYGSAFVDLGARVKINGYVMVRNIARDTAYYQADATPKAVISSTITANAGESAIYTNGDDKSGAIIEITSSAKITSPDDIAIYLPSGNLTVRANSGTNKAKITGATAIYIKSGSLNVLGGEITGNGEAKAYTAYGNGAYPTGEAIVVENCNYGGNGKPVVTVSAGTITSVNSNAIGSYASGKDADGNDYVALTKSEIIPTNPSVILYSVLNTPSHDYTTDGTGFVASSGEQKVAVIDGTLYWVISYGVLNTKQICVEDIKIRAYSDGWVDITEYSTITEELDIKNNIDTIYVKLLSASEIQAAAGLANEVDTVRIRLTTCDRYMNTFASYVNAINNSNIYNGTSGNYATAIFDNTDGNDGNDALHQNFNKAKKIYDDYICSLSGFDSDAVETEFLKQYKAGTFDATALKALFVSDNNLINAESLASFFKIRFDVFQKVWDAKAAWDEAVKADGEVNLLDTQNVKYSTKATWDELYDSIYGDNGLDSYQQFHFWELVGDDDGAKKNFLETLPAAYKKIEQLAIVAANNIEKIEYYNGTAMDNVSTGTIVVNSATSIEIALEYLNDILNGATGTDGNGWKLADIEYTADDFSAEKSALISYLTTTFISDNASYLADEGYTTTFENMSAALTAYDNARTALDALKAQAKTVKDAINAFKTVTTNTLGSVVIDATNHYKAQETAILTIKAAYDALYTNETYNDMRKFFHETAFSTNAGKDSGCHEYYDDANEVQPVIAIINEVWTNYQNVIFFNSEVASNLKNCRKSNREFCASYQFTSTKSDEIIAQYKDVNFGIIYDLTNEAFDIIYYFDRPVVVGVIDYYYNTFDNINASASGLTTREIMMASAKTGKDVLDNILEYTDNDTTKDICGGMLWDFATELAKIYQTDLNQVYAPAITAGMTDAQKTAAMTEANKKQEKLLDNILAKYEAFSDAQKESFCPDYVSKTGFDVIENATNSEYTTKNSDNDETNNYAWYEDKNSVEKFHWSDWLVYDNAMRFAFRYREAVIEEIANAKYSTVDPDETADSGDEYVVVSNATVDGYVATKTLCALYHAMDELGQSYCKDYYDLIDELSKKFDKSTIDDSKNNIENMINEAVKQLKDVDISDVKGNITTLQDKVKALEDADEDLQEQIGDLNDVLVPLYINKYIISLVDYINALYAITGDGEDVKTSLTDSVLAIKDQIGTLANLSTLGLDDISSVEDIVISLNKKINALKGDVGELPEGYDTLVAYVDALVEAINNKIGTEADEATKDTVYGYINSVKALVGQLENLANVDLGVTDTTSLETIIASLETKLSDVIAYIGTIPTESSATNIVAWVQSIVGDSTSEGEDTIYGQINGIKAAIGDKEDMYNPDTGDDDTLYGYINYFDKVEKDAREADVKAINDTIGELTALDIYDADATNTIALIIAKLEENMNAADKDIKENFIGNLEKSIGVETPVTKTVSAWIDVLDEKINTEIADRKAAIGEVDDDVTEETVYGYINKICADLTALINAEETARKTEDEAIHTLIGKLGDSTITGENVIDIINKLNAKTQKADEDLNALINTVSTSLTTSISKLNDTIKAIDSNMEVKYSDFVKEIDKKINEINTDSEAIHLALDELANALDAEAKARAEKDEYLEKQIYILIEKYTAGDVEISGNVNDIIKAYVAADAKVTDAYTAADKVLNDTITSLYTSADTTLKTSLEAADSKLENKINAIKSAMDVEIAGIEKTISSLESTLRTLITAEETARKNADTEIYTAIDKVINAYESADLKNFNELEKLVDNVQDNLDKEVINLTKAYENAIAELKEVSDKADKELADLFEANKDAINKEIDNRIQAINDLRCELQLLVEQEKSARELADSEIYNKINEVINDYETADTKNLTDINERIEQINRLIDEQVNNLQKADDDITEAYTKAIAASKKLCDEADAELKKLISDNFDELYKLIDANKTAIDNEIADRKSEIKRVDEAIKDLANLIGDINVLNDITVDGKAIFVGTSATNIAETLDKVVNEINNVIDDIQATIGTIPTDDQGKPLYESVVAWIKAIVGKQDSTDVSTIYGYINNVNTSILAIIGDTDDVLADKTLYGYINYMMDFLNLKDINGFTNAFYNIFKDYFDKDKDYQYANTLLDYINEFYIDYRKTCSDIGMRISDATLLKDLEENDVILHEYVTTLYGKYYVVGENENPTVGEITLAEKKDLSATMYGYIYYLEEAIGDYTEISDYEFYDKGTGTTDVSDMIDNLDNYFDMLIGSLQFNSAEIIGNLTFTDADIEALGKIRNGQTREEGYDTTKNITDVIQSLNDLVINEINARIEAIGEEINDYTLVNTLTAKKQQALKDAGVEITDTLKVLDLTLEQKKLLATDVYGYIYYIQQIYVAVNEYTSLKLFEENGEDKNVEMVTNIGEDVTSIAKILDNMVAKLNSYIGLMSEIKTENLPAEFTAITGDSVVDYINELNRLIIDEINARIKAIGIKITDDTLIADLWESQKAALGDVGSATKVGELSLEQKKLLAVDVYGYIYYVNEVYVAINSDSSLKLFTTELFTSDGKADGVNSVYNVLANMVAKLNEYVGDLQVTSTNLTAEGFTSLDNPTSVTNLIQKLNDRVIEEINARLAAIGTPIADETAAKDVTEAQKATLYGYIYYINKVEEEARVEADDEINAIIGEFKATLAKGAEEVTNEDIASWIEYLLNAANDWEDKLEAEKADRQSNVNAEKDARNDAIDAEKVDRQAADVELQEQLDTALGIAIAGFVIAIVATLTACGLLVYVIILKKKKN